LAFTPRIPGGGILVEMVDKGLWALAAGMARCFEYIERQGERAGVAVACKLHARVGLDTSLGLRANTSMRLVL
jgi:hypothetical protein